MDENKVNYLILGAVILGFIVLAMLINGFGLKGDFTFVFNMYFCPLRESLLKYSSLVEWSSYNAGGQAGLVPEQPILELVYFLYMIFNDPNIAATLASWIYASFGIAGIYLLVFNLTSSNKAAVLSSLFFFLNSFFFSFFRSVSFNYITPYLFIPWIFYFYLAMKEDTYKIILNSMLIGGLLSIAFLAGGMSLIVWIVFTLPLFIFLDLLIFGKGRIQFKIKKMVIVLLVVMLAFAGLSAFKAYPAAKFIEKTNRNQGWDLNAFIGQKIEIKDFIKLNFSTVVLDNLMKTGLFPLILILLGLVFGYKKRNFLKFFLIFLSGIIIAANLFSVASLLSLVPVLNKARHVIRFAGIYQFSAAVLIGLSFYYLSKKLEDGKFKKYSSLLFVLAALLLLFELLYPVLKIESSETGKFVNADFEKYYALKDTGMLNSERHRIHMLGKDWVIGTIGEQYLCRLGIETMDWDFGNAWIVDYTTFTLWAGSNLEQAAKLWGILNAKYVVAEDPKRIDPVYTKAVLNYKNNTDYFVPGLNLVKRWPSCPSCFPDITLLYENSRFLPRIYLVNKSILMLGEKNSLQNLYGYILLNDNFEPKTTVLIGKNFIDEDLSRYSAIILGRQPNSREAEKLRQFKGSGGVILPDIFNNENQLDSSRLNELLNKFKNGPAARGFSEEYYSPNKRAYAIDENTKGFLVISENFYTYRDEWAATLNSEEKEFYNANFAVSAIYLDDEKGHLEFSYDPVYLKRGGIISMATLAVIIAFIVFYIKKGRKISK